MVEAVKGGFIFPLASPDDRQPFARFDQFGHIRRPAMKPSSSSSSIASSPEPEAHVKLLERRGGFGMEFPFPRQ